MSLAEQTSSTELAVYQHQAAGLMDGIITDLEVLTIGTPIPPPSAFDYDGQAYNDYLERVRYRCGIVQSIGSQGVMTSVLMLANNLLETGAEKWNLLVQQRGDDMSPDMGRGNVNYTAQMRLYKKGEASVQKMVAVEYVEEFDVNGPRLKYRDINGLTAAEIAIEPSEIVSSFPYRVLSEAAEELRREANGLIDLAFDLPAA
ncbi:MAG TPA: hypothetical protein VLE74_01460 [Candidatus Saccharimonadales bacterium]|nr:hypothetical protein [Candidatus Saccharimonadales bacterium]